MDIDFFLSISKLILHSDYRSVQNQKTSTCCWNSAFRRSWRWLSSFSKIFDLPQGCFSALGLTLAILHLHIYTCTLTCSHTKYEKSLEKKTIMKHDWNFLQSIFCSAFVSAYLPLLQQPSALYALALYIRKIFLVLTWFFTVVSVQFFSVRSLFALYFRQVVIVRA